jgi:hypothetical protein
LFTFEDDRPPHPDTIDEALIRRLWVLKVYRDIVVDGRGTTPVDSAEVLRPRNATEFRQEDIGYLTKPVRLDEWIPTVRSRYAFVAGSTPTSGAGSSATSEISTRSTRHWHR